MTVRLVTRYREFRVFEHRDEDLLIRVCFERLHDGHVAVPQTEFLRDGMDVEKRLAEIGLNTVEFLLDPDAPLEWDFYPSIDEAIAAHDDEFRDLVAEIKNAAN